MMERVDLNKPLFILKKILEFFIISSSHRCQCIPGLPGPSPKPTGVASLPVTEKFLTTIL